VFENISNLNDALMFKFFKSDTNKVKQNIKRDEIKNVLQIKLSPGYLFGINHFFIISDFSLAGSDTNRAKS
jgi:hypothetical protein